MSCGCTSNTIRSATPQVPVSAEPTPIWVPRSRWATKALISGASRIRMEQRTSLARTTTMGSSSIRWPPTICLRPASSMGCRHGATERLRRCSRPADTYFLICSHETGWNSNDDQYSYATSISGPWSALADIATAGTNTWNSQSTYVVPVTGSSGTTYIYMGDRWISGDITNHLHLAATDRLRQHALPALGQQVDAECLRRDMDELLLHLASNWF